MDVHFTPPVASSMPAQYLPLAGDARVTLASAACVAARTLPGACQHCAQACPVDALKVGESGPSFITDCLGCGRCAAACPTGAIVLKGFADSGTLPQGNAPLRVECWKVRASLSGHTALRVPCLGGLGVDQLLEWLARSGGRPLQLVDRGWCGQCRAGGSVHPAQRIVEEIGRVLHACGQDAGERISLVSEPLPLRLMPEAIPEPATQEKIGRRDFFRRFAAEAAAALPAAPRPAAPRLRRGNDFPLPKRERILAALETLTQAPADRLPAAVLPGLTIRESCDHLGVCAGMCPTGALYTYEDEDHAGAVFDPRDCVACGLCAQACPEQAIEVLAAGSSDAQAAAQAVTRFPLVRCGNCLTPFAATQGATLCPACQRSRQMSCQLFGTQLANG